MNPAQSAFQALPENVRKILYVVVALLGLALGVLQAVDVTDLGPLTMTQALQVYAFLSPLVGAVAVANVGRVPAGATAGTPEPSGLGAYADDIDLSAFEPVGDMADVYGVEAGYADAGDDRHAVV